MGNKELYELRSQSIKAKYSKIIKAMSEKPLTEADILKFKEESLQEIKEIKQEKYNTLKYYQKHIKYSNILADVLLFLGICGFTLGLVFGLKQIDNQALEITFFVLGGVFIISAAVAFGYLMHVRQKRQEYLKDSISESEIGSTKLMINDFCSEALEKINNKELND